MIDFPNFTGIRCLMMPYVQGDPDSVPEAYEPYYGTIESVAIAPGKMGFLTIDESFVPAGKPQRAAHARFERALHTEAGLYRDTYMWGGPPWGWGGSGKVTLERDLRVLIANSVDGSCAIWDTEHEDTSFDGDIGDVAHMYPMADAKIMAAGDLEEIGILTPHESLPVTVGVNRQFLRIVGSGVHGREDHFTTNPLLC